LKQSYILSIHSIVSVITGHMTQHVNSPLKAYIHQLAWLQYVSLALTAAVTLYSGSVDAEVMSSASQLYETNIQTTIDYLEDHANTHQPLGK